MSKTKSTIENCVIGVLLVALCCMALDTVLSRKLVLELVRLCRMVCITCLVGVAIPMLIIGIAMLALGTAIVLRPSTLEHRAAEALKVKRQYPFRPVGQSFPTYVWRVPPGQLKRARELQAYVDRLEFVYYVFGIIVIISGLCLCCIKF